MKVDGFYETLTPSLKPQIATSQKTQIITLATKRTSNLPFCHFATLRHTATKVSKACFSYYFASLLFYFIPLYNLSFLLSALR
jgi:hypothetical protein